jgi:transposase-like protein
MRVRWSEHEARSAISAWRKSGLSVEKFARERGLVPQRIYWWRKKLEVPAKAAAKPAPSMSLLPVQVTATRARGEPVAVFLRTGHIVKVGRDFDEEAFARVVALLEGA